jgi:hypothetical protein
MSALAVFYHIWSPAETDVWRLLVDEQLKKIESVGLHRQAKVACCIAGPQHLAIRDFVTRVPWVEIIEHTEEEVEFEGLTLKHVYQRCVNDLTRKTRCVAYLHTKGIRHFTSRDANLAVIRNANSWRHLLEYGVLERWQECVERLGTHDVAGINFHEHPAKHFGGNFWWANADYIRKLAHPHSKEFATLDIADAANVRRVGYEMWIGSGDPNPFGFEVRGGFGLDLYTNDIFSYIR